LKKVQYSIIPRHWIFLEQFPLSSHGKIDRKVLESLVWNQIKQQSHQVFHDPIVQEIYNCWAEELGNPEIGLDEDFFMDLGGSSLGAELMMGELSRILCKNLPTSLIYTHRTIQKLAEQIKVEPDPLFPFLEWKKKSTGSAFHLVFVEVGYFDSFQEIIQPIANQSDFSILNLRYDLYQILDGKNAEEELDKITALIRPFNSVCMIGVSFNGWVAAKIAERLSSPVVIVDTPGYRKDGEKFLNKTVFSKWAYAWNQIQSKGFQATLPAILSSFSRMLRKKMGEKIPKSIFEQSVEAYLRQGKAVEKLSKVLYVYSTNSLITSEKDVSSWQKKTVDNFQLYRLYGDHLDACSERFGRIVADKIIGFLS
jgi:hypothetical protein